MAESREPPRENSEDAITRVAGPDDVGTRLDIFLARQPELGSRVRAKELVRSGLVQVDGRGSKPGQTLQLGQAVTFRLPEEAPEPEPEAMPPPDIPVIHEDLHLLVIHKPAGIAVHAPSLKRSKIPTVASLMVERFGELPKLAGEDRPGIVHRLDKDTSGVMVLARNDESFHFLRGQFKARSVRKEYRALVYGDPRFDSEHVERSIGPDPRNPSRMAIRDERGRQASTYYEVAERLGDFAYLRCFPKTGRTHQIRVHMMSVGHSLIGDRLYRSRKAWHRDLPPEAPDPGRQCLHALRIGLRHPRTHEEVEFEAPLAADFAKLLDWLRGQQQTG
jgi:23S rRNA pseudouridine1911/1915/1917 synthase